MLFQRSADLPPLSDRRKSKRKGEVRRRPERSQGKALEALAHAIEYLVDNAETSGCLPSAATMEAVELLAEKSRAVFAECAVITPLPQRLTNLFARFFAPSRGQGRRISGSTREFSADATQPTE